MNAQTISPQRRSAGRPPRFTLEQVIDAACEIGLESVDMVSVAKKLGVGVATLYGYVEGRDHLVRLAAQRLASRSGIADTGQSWQDALREHARRSFATYRETPQLISQLMSGVLGDLADSQHTNALLAILIERGLDPRQAFSLYLEANQIVIGAAVGAAYSHSMIERAGGNTQFIRNIHGKCEAKGFQALDACLADGNLFDTAADYHPNLDRLIATYETESGQ